MTEGIDRGTGDKDFQDIRLVEAIIMTDGNIDEAKLDSLGRHHITKATR